MTREEAVARIKNHKIVHKMNEPRAIYISEALDMAIQALNQEPKQVELEGDGYAYGTDEIVYDFGKCPNCGWEFEEGDKDWEEPYCCHCGQRLEWFDDEAESED